VLCGWMGTAAQMPAQTTRSGEQGSLRLMIGGGGSDFNSAWQSRLQGPTVWVDWALPLKGLGIEAQGTGLYGEVSNYNLRQGCALMGGIYRWEHYRNIRPYTKFLGGIGNLEVAQPNASYSLRDKGTVYEPGGGIEVRLWRKVWVRGDFSYQFWSGTLANDALTPNGVTLGVMYDFRHTRPR